MPSLPFAGGIARASQPPRSRPRAGRDRRRQGEGRGQGRSGTPRRRSSRARRSPTRSRRRPASRSRCSAPAARPFCAASSRRWMPAASRSTCSPIPSPPAAKCARQEGPVPRLQAEEFRQGAGRRQGPERAVRRAAPQHDDALSAQRQSRSRRRAENLGRPRRSQIQGQAGDDRSVLHRRCRCRWSACMSKARGWGFYEKLRAERHDDRAGQPAGRPTCSSAASG